MKKSVPIIIVTNITSSRIQYVCEWIFVERIGRSFKLVTPDEAKSFQDVFISYGVPEIQADLNIDPSRWLEEGHVSEDVPRLMMYEGIPVPVWGRHHANTTPDLLGAIFWSLSRVEEYGNGKDKHGRFPAESSWAYQQNILLEPWVDRIVALLASSLNLETIETRSISPSIDIDDAFAFKGRGMRLISGLVGDIWHQRWDFLKARLRWIFGLSKDPFDVYEILEKTFETDVSRPLFFFLVADQINNLNNNISPDKEALKQLVQRISKHHDLGIHPSYQSMEDQTLVSSEKKTLEEISNKAIHRSRFHYLRYRMPHSFQGLISAGIQEDHSMIYPDAAGFRAGTAESFQWYDLTNERVTSLRIFPYLLMDRTLRDYMGYGPEQAIEMIREIYEKCQQLRVPFSWIWHNSTLSEVEGWGQYYQVWRFLSRLR
jgi:hypothetical protein